MNNEEKNIAIRLVTIEDYDAIFELWNSTEQSRRALNPVDDTREGIDKYLKRNPNTCFAAVSSLPAVSVPTLLETNALTTLTFAPVSLSTSQPLMKY